MAAAVGERVELEFPARPEYLSLVRVVVGTVAGHGPPLEPLRVNDLCLAVSEACANAIDAYADDAGSGLITVDFAIAGDRLEVEITDRAGGFDLGTIRAGIPTPHPERERGLGLPLMRVLTDEMEVSSSNGGTAVRLVMLGGRRR
ncbi:MAG: ATP-binding protein [Acidimicrobiales bacterium]